MKPITIHGAGCSLIDFLYTGIDFSSPAFAGFRSRRDGDGGLEPGKLVFSEEFEQFCGRPFAEALAELSDGREPDTVNLGGPAIVALINAAQLLHSTGTVVRFFGIAGDDSKGDMLLSMVRRSPVDTTRCRRVPRETPSTVVLSDPSYDDGRGERVFVNTIGAAGEMKPKDLNGHFFDADIVLLGATALVPRVHDSLGALVAQARRRGSVTVVSTVYDFRNQKKNPSRSWPLGQSDDTYTDIDVLITDNEEALRLSGCGSANDALAFFAAAGVSSAIITHGPNPVHFFADGRLFAQAGPGTLPVSQAAGREVEKGKAAQGDTTGCGDNFAGGVLASLAAQLSSGKRGEHDIQEAVSWGVASGAAALFYVGGTYTEKQPGEKHALVRRYYDLYREQLSSGQQCTA